MTTAWNTFVGQPEPDMHTSPNAIIVTGRLVPPRRRRTPVGQANGKETVGAQLKDYVVTYTNQVRGVTDHMRLQVVDGGGAIAYGLDVRLANALRLEGSAVLEAVIADYQRLVVWGYLDRPATYDGRYGNQQSIELEDRLGRAVSPMTVIVQGFRAATPDDADGAWIALQGAIAYPPAFRRHAKMTALEVARTNVRVAYQQPLPGRPFSESFAAALPVEIPTDLPSADYAYRMGNIVRVQGRLEPFRETLGKRIIREDAHIQEALQRLDAGWETRRPTLEAHEHESAYRTYLRDRDRLQQHQDLRVRVGALTVVSGDALSREEADVLHDEWVRRKQQRRLLTSGTDSSSGATPLPHRRRRPASVGGMPDPAHGFQLSDTLEVQPTNEVGMETALLEAIPDLAESRPVVTPDPITD